MISTIDACRAVNALPEADVALTLKVTVSLLCWANLLSVRTVQTFLQLVRATPHVEALSHIRAVAFSPPIAEALRAVAWRNIAVCEQPTMPSLLETIDKLAAAD